MQNTWLSTSSSSSSTPIRKSGTLQKGPLLSYVLTTLLEALLPLLALHGVATHSLSFQTPPLLRVTLLLTRPFTAQSISTSEILTHLSQVTKKTMQSLLQKRRIRRTFTMPLLSALLLSSGLLWSHHSSQPVTQLSVISQSVSWVLQWLTVNASFSSTDAKSRTLL